MNFNFEKIVDQIINTTEFQGLKNFVENNGGHDHEIAYDHSIATYERMKDIMSSRQISDEEARNKFKKMLNEQIDGVGKKDLLAITALLHDIGKSIYSATDGKTYNMNVIQPDGTTASPDHRHFGSVWAGNILQKLGFSRKVQEYIIQIIGLHIGSAVFTIKDDEFFSFVKSISENLYAEILLLMHTDLFNHPDYTSRLKDRTIKILNNPNFYKL